MQIVVDMAQHGPVPTHIACLARYGTVAQHFFAEDCGHEKLALFFIPAELTGLWHKPIELVGVVFKLDRGLEIRIRTKAVFRIFVH